MFLMQAMTWRLQELGVYLDVPALVEAVDNVLIDKAKVSCSVCQRAFKYRSVMLEHMAVKHLREELQKDFPESFQNKQV